MYIYRTKIYHDADVSDFEAQHMSLATEVDEVAIADTTFIADLLYADFESLIDGVAVSWSDVKYRRLYDGRYMLTLASLTELP